MQAMTPITPLDPGVEMFERAKPQSLFISTFPVQMPLERSGSRASIAFTDIEDDSSDFEEYSLGSSSDHRRSQTTISTFEEIQTPGESDIRTQYAEWYLPKAVQGPKGPHLFRASQSSNDFPYDFALQLSPLCTKEPPARFHTSFRDGTPDTVVPRREYDNIASAVAHLDNAEVRSWTSREVATWMYQNGFDDEVIDRFEAHDITGAVLLDLQFDDLKELEIQSFGKRHQLWNQIDSLRSNDGLLSPVQPAVTPFEDTDRPCTGAPQASKGRNRDRRHRDKSRGADCEDDDTKTPITPGGRHKRGRRLRNPNDDIITPAESVSIVAIEQLLPKPHRCAKGERCAKWKKQQRQLARLRDEHGLPISPEKGGHIFIAGDPGNAQTAPHAVENVYRPMSDAIPSVVASSDVLGPGQLPGFTLDSGMLQKLEQRDPQDSVRQFLTLQGVQQPYSTATPIEAPSTPPIEMFPAKPSIVQSYDPDQQVSTFSASTSAHTSGSFDSSMLTSHTLHPPEFIPVPHFNLKSLPRLSIPPPRSASAAPRYGGARAGPSPITQVAPDTFTPCRTASPGGVYRFGTPFSEMDVPVTAVPIEPVSRDTSQSVPPNMVYRDPVQQASSRTDWRRPSLPLPALDEEQVFSTSDAFDGDTATLNETQFGDESPVSEPSATAKPDTLPAQAALTYNGANYHGWMKKRRTKLLRHEWQDHHFRLQGTTLAMHANELPTTSALQTIDVDDYAVACSSLASSKLSAKLKALKLSSGQKDKTNVQPAFEFQLVPTIPSKSEIRKVMPNGKVHHFAVKSRDDRIDWMRELMLAKALRAKNDGYEVTVNGATV